MTTIAPRIKKILAIVEELKEAIINKGVDVPETALFPELPDYIKQIVTLDFDFTEIITDTFGSITDEIPDTIYSSSTFNQITDTVEEIETESEEE